VSGHFYSPIVNPKELINKQEVLWPLKPEILGIDFNPNYHRQVLEVYFPRHIKNYNYVEKVEQVQSACEFYSQNSQFSWFDPRLLFVLLNQWKPQTMIEVGSGFSTMLTADINHRLLNNGIDFRCIEPYPKNFLLNKINGLNEIIIKKVQDVDKKIFQKLKAGDILFIDSSHVAKTGSDVNFLFFEILPILNQGVKIHFHDIHLPHEYSKDWVLNDNRSWNEQYLLRALLMYSDTFKVLFGSSYAHYKYPEQVIKALNLPKKQGFGGGSIWIEKIK
jgi:hypothetical protein